jgi:iron complex outermembrane receptor protein
MNKISRLLLLLIFSTLSCKVWSQKLEGTVYSKKGEILTGAEIHLLNTVTTTYSDSSGRFSLNTQPGKYVLIVEAVGYITQTDSIALYSDSVLHLRITMIPVSIEMNEVLITASKTESPQLRVPTALSTLSAEKIIDTKTWDLSSLVGIVPNFQYGDLGVGYQQQIAIRGISIFSETPATATYIDGVNALDIASNGFQLIDVERIEILRGPQGTLYGRNALGGVINIITKAPSNSTTGFAEAHFGNQGLQKYALGIKTPLISQKLFFGLTAQYQFREGFYTNDLQDKTSFLHEPLAGSPEDGKRMGDESSWYSNLYCTYFPSPNSKITFNSKFQYDQSIGASMYFQAVENNEEAIENPYKMAVNNLGSNNRKVWNNALAWIIDLKNFRVSSTLAFQQVWQAYQGIDQDLYPYDLATGASFGNELGDPYKQSVWSHELRFSSSAGSKIKWTFGSYLFYQHYDKKYASIYQDLALFFGIQPGIEKYRTDQNNSGIAGFGQIEIPFQKKWSFLTGIRFDAEQRKTSVERYYELNNADKVYSVDTSLNSRFNALSPKLGISFFPNDSKHLYFTYSRGFRAGGNNMFTKGKYSGYLPEVSDNFELGFKFRNRKKNLSWNSCVFYLIWKNMQLDVQPEPGIWIIDNIGNANALGLESELSYRPFKNTYVDVSLGINQGRYGDFNFLSKNISGNSMILAPEYTLMTALQQNIPLNKKVNFKIRMEARQIGNQFFDLHNTIMQPAYLLLNARIGISGSNWNVFLWCQNISNTTYITYAMPGYFKYSLINRPRTFGISISWNFTKKES